MTTLITIERVYNGFIIIENEGENNRVSVAHNEIEVMNLLGNMIKTLGKPQEENPVVPQPTKQEL